MPLKLIRTVISNLCNLNLLMLHLFTELTIVGGFLWVLVSPPCVQMFVHESAVDMHHKIVFTHVPVCKEF